VLPSLPLWPWPYSVTPGPSTFGCLPCTPLDEYGALRVGDHASIDLDHPVGELQPREHRVWCVQINLRAATGCFRQRKRWAKQPSVSPSPRHAGTVPASADRGGLLRCEWRLFSVFLGRCASQLHHGPRTVL
jgi:hypothetical protein